MTYPIERIVNRFLQNPHGVLNKTFIEILTDFYGDTLARVTFIHALRHFVNSGITDTMHPRAGQHGTHPYAVVLAEGASGRLQQQAPCLAAVSAESQRLYPFPGVAGAFIDTGVLLGTPQQMGSAERMWDGAYKDNLERILAEQDLSRSSNITTRYYDKTYDLLLKDDYTDTAALITALNADPLFSADNRRNWA